MSMARLVQLWEPVNVAPPDQDTTDAYEDVAGSKIDSETKGKVAFTILNAHAANAIKWKVLASLDDVTYIEVEAEAAVAALAAGSWIASATEVSFRYFKVQVKSAVAATPGTAQVRGYAKI
jgi:hypothetical protein